MSVYLLDTSPSVWHPSKWVPSLLERSALCAPLHGIAVKRPFLVRHAPALGIAIALIAPAMIAPLLLVFF